MCYKHYTRWKRHGDPHFRLRRLGDLTPEAQIGASRRAANEMKGDQPCYLLSYGFCTSQARVYVHHVNENPLDNRPENLRPLCMRHHMLVHRGDFDLENPDHSRYYVTVRGTLRPRRRAA